MYENYHSKYIVYPVLQEHKIIQYLKDHKLKNLINNILHIIKPFEDVLIKLLLKEDNLIIQLLYSTTIKRDITEHTTQKIKQLIKQYRNIKVTYHIIKAERFNTLRGFN